MYKQQFFVQYSLYIRNCWVFPSSSICNFHITNICHQNIFNFVILRALFCKINLQFPDRPGWNPSITQCMERVVQPITMVPQTCTSISLSLSSPEPSSMNTDVFIHFHCEGNAQSCIFTTHTHLYLLCTSQDILLLGMCLFQALHYIHTLIYAIWSPCFAT